MKTSYKTINHWRRMWSRHPERMRANLESINVLQSCKVEQRATRLKGVLRLLPDHPLAPSSMRDHVSEAWLTLFSEELPPERAWLEVRFGIRRGIIVRTHDGLYQVGVDK